MSRAAYDEESPKKQGSSHEKHIAIQSLGSQYLGPTTNSSQKHGIPSHSHGAFYEMVRIKASNFDESKASIKVRMGAYNMQVWSAMNYQLKGRKALQRRHIRILSVKGIIDCLGRFRTHNVVFRRNRIKFEELGQFLRCKHLGVGTNNILGTHSERKKSGDLTFDQVECEEKMYEDRGDDK
nr:hypothetical protein [Tanacetum cinerariifolium]